MILDFISTLKISYEIIVKNIWLIESDTIYIYRKLFFNADLVSFFNLGKKSAASLEFETNFFLWSIIRQRFC